MGKEKNIKKIFLHLIQSNSGPHEIALGVAIGVFIGFLPLYGLHTAMVVVIALLIPHTNRIGMLLGINVTMPFTAPFVYWASYCVGRFLTGDKVPALTIANIKGLGLSDIPSMYYALFYGCVVLGAVCAALFYAMAFYAVKALKKK
jgi:uncharacterized protein